jgi:cytochrome c oxidase subunit 2
MNTPTTITGGHLPLADAGGSLWFSAPSSTGASDVDRLFFFILGLCVFFFVMIVGAMVFFIVRYRSRPGHRETKTATHNNWLELTWSVIPTILVGVIFLWGFLSYVNARTPPDNSYEIQVIAKKWSWSFIYPNGHVDNNLHVPVDRPVTLVMSSDDVIHSLYIPAFRLKMDVVPGRYSKTWFQATAIGQHTLFCAEYCGTGHSTMSAKVVVHRSGEFEKWLDEAANFMKDLTPVEAGEILYTRRGCVQCHSIDGSAKAGPSFKGAFGQEHQMTTGETVVVDENYIRESILEPQAKVRAGYRPVMPTYQGQLKDEEIAALIQFIKSLR